MTIENRDSRIENPPALYRAVWRWHFFAGLFVAPFAVDLAFDRLAQRQVAVGP